ncbi:MAG: hypothetical protein JWM18_2910 [Chloroflexi bacterium]|jgi:hypothetical protein|nr:hypothetical protein [Chloroflexota bacterium]
MGDETKDFNTAEDPAHPQSTGRVGGKGGISTAAEGESRMPETPFDSVTHEGEDVTPSAGQTGTHKEGVRKAEEMGQDEEHESLGTTGAGRPAGRQGPGSNRPTDSGAAQGDQPGAGQTNV